MQFIDTHAHINYKPLLQNHEQVIEAALANHVTQIICVGTDIPSSYTAIKLAEKFHCVYAAAGYHPHDIESAKNGWQQELEKLLQHEKTVALGEIGLDNYRNYSPKELQIKFFAEQIEIAKSMKMPMIIHNREADEDTEKLLIQANYFNGVMHCFGSDAEYAQKMVQLGLMISFTGNITYGKNITGQKAVRATPMNHLMLETDCPFLSPEPRRGRTNAPENIPFIADKVAELKKISVEEVAGITTENAVRFFNLKT
ncbi:MAG: TatD family hydrolase [Candidatus Marinimicrobia bacterium]|nr:TatD family hydrolase [Candidatus Neomarinimicrobiota bacterium]